MKSSKEPESLSWARTQELSKSTQGSPLLVTQEKLSTESTFHWRGSHEALMLVSEIRLDVASGTVIECRMGMYGRGPLSTVQGLISGFLRALNSWSLKEPTPGEPSQDPSHYPIGEDTYDPPSCGCQSGTAPSHTSQFTEHST